MNRDVLKAVEKEKEYLSFRIKGEEPFHLVDAVKECGFGTLEEYFKAKKEYELGALTFEVIPKNPSDCITECLRLLDTQTTAIVSVDCDETFVYFGESKPFNEAYCEEHNIPTYPLYTAGGAIVGAAGDFSVGICIPDSIQIDDKFMLEKVCGILSKNIDGITVDRNDILHNGNKICATTGYRRNGMYLFIAHFSFSDRLDIIAEVCAVQTNASTYSMRRTTYQPEKMPAYIDWMSREDVKQGLSAWLNI